MAQSLKRLQRLTLLFLALLLVVTTRCWDHGQILVDGQLYFVDADCYSRMSRVQAVVEHPTTIWRHQDFENWPDGTTPHTTMPLDWLIALPVWLGVPLDWSGALIPLALALATAAVLWKWVARFRFFTQVGVLLLFAVSPILVHGQAFGRPDHQALLILLAIVAFAAEWELQARCSGVSMTAGFAGGTAVIDAPLQNIAILCGLAWGLAIWVSLFEPIILLLLFTLGSLAAQRRAWFNRDRAVTLLSIGGVLLVALLIEHWRTPALPGGVLFQNWSRSVGELTRPGWFSPIFLSWLGLSALAVPFLPFILGWDVFKRRQSEIIPWLVLFLATYILGTTMLRWGYFLAIAFLFLLPFGLEKIRNRWIMALFFVGFWPVAAEWDRMLDRTESANVAEQIEDYRQLRAVAAEIRAVGGAGILAPWWLSPPLAYWSGVPCVAGSSHQSLPGIGKTATFYLSRFPEKSLDLLRRRRVRWVVAYEPDRVLSTSSQILGIPSAPDAFGAILYNTPRRVPPALTLQKETPFFKLYRVAESP